MRKFLTLLALSTSLSAAEIDFDKQIQPIFKKHCFECHGDKKSKGGLALHQKSLAFKEADSGEVVLKPGDEASLLLELIAEEDEDFRMPPKKHKPLSKEQISLIRQWIKQGAKWPEKASAAKVETHWAYIDPVKVRLPDVKIKNRVGNFIDHFILAKLEKEGLTPEDQASPEKLIRRLSLDLTGLPADLSLVDSFVADSSKKNYERIVDQLLASPSYGEHWARHWLDLARFADSDGYQRDGFRTVWPYRDWVIKAFNKDMPFDQFSIEQLAGDLIPHRTELQLIATGFNRGSTLNLEAGSDVEEDRVKQVVERVNTMGTIWLGSSVSCAQCHNHKYDPFSIKEYYQLYAYFNNTPREGKMINQTTRTLAYSGPLHEYFSANQDKKTWQKNLKVEKKKSSEYLKLMQSLTKNKKKNKLAAARKLQLKQFKQHEQLNSLWQSIENAQDLVKQHAPAQTRVMQEMDEARQTKILLRGNFLDPGQVVKPGVPAFLHKLPDNAPKNRLGLAQWLTSKENPLVARAAVNRFWREFFGYGLYESLEDIGKQGEAPTHPQLLDYLAVDFMDKDWSVKTLLKTIVMSSTYKQSSVCSEKKRKSDPYNRLLSRGPAFRLSAEAIRDNALKLSGLLSTKMYGPPVLPPQPNKVWRVIGSVDNTYRTSKDEDQYRRGIYTIWRRHAHYPSFSNFDAPNRSICTVKRSRSNTPMQALTLMNDPAYVAIAQAFGRKIATLPGKEDQRISRAFRLCTARSPNTQELQTLKHILKQEDADPNQQYDRWFTLATVLLNLHETINKD